MAATSIVDHVKDAFYALSSCFCATDSTLKLNGRSFKIISLLGEGGFSYVYLAQDLASGRQFALKKIRCPLGSDSVREAMKEAEAYKRFRHPNIIRCLDSCIIQDGQEEGGKIIYLFLPYYKNGTVQHVISDNAVNGLHYPELSMLQIFLGTCEAVRAMHHHVSGAKPSYPPPSPLSSLSKPDGESTEEEDAEDHLAEEGAALMNQEERDAAGEGVAPSMGGPAVPPKTEEAGKAIAWAHRDIKPANIMLADDGVTPILMDFGSALPARIPIPDRRAAVLQQDLAAEHCSMPFRAPELFDVKTGVDLTEAVDIWSLGCTLFAMAYSNSPFETSQQSEHGGSIAMAVLNGKYSFPKDGNYSEGFRELIQLMIKVKPEERPNIDQVIEATKQAIARLS
ncbi:serine/threonine-protein kinase [Pseudohyphozyma bogoriensis]|nr:serine/threonine-protein kinase [Pseudohyphozyma bogoriensis]